MGGNPNSFYDTLFSNSSMNVYMNNTIAAFMVQLAHGIDLGTDKWEVALYLGTIRPLVFVGDTNALIYWNLINPQFI